MEQFDGHVRFRNHRHLHPCSKYLFVHPLIQHFSRSYAMSPQSALVRTWLRLLRTIIDCETSLVHDLRVLSLGFYRPFIYEVVRQSRLAENKSPDRLHASQWLSNEDVGFLFGNLETAYAVHAAFLTSLEWQFSQWPNPGWGGFTGPFRMVFSSLRTMISAMGSNPQQLSRQTYERLSLLPEFNELVKQVRRLQPWSRANVLRVATAMVFYLCVICSARICRYVRDIRWWH
jgi:hypothetical protein